MRALPTACFAVAVPLLLAACSSSAPRYSKQANESDAQTAMSECEYQIRLNKTPKADQDELRNLCMQGKGYRGEKSRRANARRSCSRPRAPPSPRPAGSS